MTTETRTTQQPASKPWSVEQRLEFIEFMSYWEGGINRSDIISRFGVSPQQASGDLTNYQALAPDNLRYDMKAKRYVPSDSFACRLIQPDADRYLGQLTAVTTHAVGQNSTWLDGDLSAAVIPMPVRRVSSDILRGVLAAVRAGRSLEIHYQSLNPSSPSVVWRRVTPHAFASDGFRWHMRAFCHRDSTFKDFVLSRCTGTRDESEPGAEPAMDRDWNESFTAIFVANPKLTHGQQRSIEQDYAMRDGEVPLPIRYALLYYFHKRLGADFAPSLLNDPSGVPREIPIVIKNLEQYLVALARVGVHLTR
ncbi:MAG: WYL domain-containing protein [Luteibacter sp.]|uniref:WYL domain-containing protein n=1 Tax=Luteibacter sp. TaxID=1886636 RepID=UPI00280877F8|nr:WYL domain-containing protein [Luteibacter sp.]MDQ7995272.1 WYL domain-containing protein [Luteibacter sp.]